MASASVLPTVFDETRRHELLRTFNESVLDPVRGGHAHAALDARAHGLSEPPLLRRSLHARCGCGPAAASPLAEIMDSLSVSWGTENLSGRC
jgi:hypothetical protein